jgi:hypothetical protein
MVTITVHVMGQVMGWSAGEKHIQIKGLSDLSNLCGKKASDFVNNLPNFVIAGGESGLLGGKSKRAPDVAIRRPRF